MPECHWCSEQFDPESSDAGEPDRFCSSEHEAEYHEDLEES
jgi:hypothetical protein